MSHYEPVDITHLGRPVNEIQKSTEEIVALKLVALEEELRKIFNQEELLAAIDGVTMTEILRSYDHPPSVLFLKEFGSVSIFIEPKLLIWMTDAYFDDLKAKNRPMRTELTSSDLRVQERVARLITHKLLPSSRWEKKPDFNYRELNGLSAITTLNIHLPEQTSPIKICFHRDYVERMNTQLRRKATDLNTDIIQQCPYIPVTLRAKIWHQKIAFSKLNSIKVGDHIPIAMSQNVPVFIGNKQYYTGSIGDSDGRLTLTLKSSI